jgi:hypothetical protein
MPGLGIVRVMYDDDDYRVTSIPYRLMPPRKRAGSGGLGEALEAARVTGPELREALDAARGTPPEPTEPDDDFSGTTSTREWRRRLGRTLGRMEIWMLIVAVAALIATVAGVVIAYLTLVKSG